MADSCASPRCAVVYCHPLWYLVKSYLKPGCCWKYVSYTEFYGDCVFAVSLEWVWGQWSAAWRRHQYISCLIWCLLCLTPTVRSVTWFVCATWYVACTVDMQRCARYAMAVLCDVGNAEPDKLIDRLSCCRVLNGIAVQCSKHQFRNNIIACAGVLCLG